MVNRAAELTVLHVTDSPIHLWLGGVQVVLAFMAGALYLEEEEYFQLRFVGEDVHCSGAMIVMAVLALIEVSGFSDEFTREMAASHW